MPNWGCPLTETMPDLDWDRAIPVDSVQQEYALIAARRCECEGRFRVVRQALLFQQGRPYDLLEAICRQCGRSERFLFDIGRFFKTDEESIRKPP